MDDTKEDAQNADDEDEPVEQVKFECNRSSRIRAPSLICSSTAEKLLPQWHSMALHPQLCKSLHHRNFLKPTPIQENCIPLALSGRDVVGVAQTVGAFLSRMK